MNALDPEQVTVVARIGLALALTTVIALEREFHARSAGLRTLTLVGVGTVLFTLVSAYGFTDIASEASMVDPARIAAQIVSGIGFLGAGLIFVKQDSVRGLTTAATVWLTAAVAMAVGAGLYLAAIVATAAHLLIVFLYPLASRWLPMSRLTPKIIHVTYLDGRGTLRQIVAAASKRRYSIDGMEWDENLRRVTIVTSAAEPGEVSRHPLRTVRASIAVSGQRNAQDLADAIGDVDGVLTVQYDA